MTLEVTRRIVKIEKKMVEMNVDVVHLIQQYMQPNDIIKQRLVHSSFNHASKFHHKIWRMKLQHLQTSTLPKSYLFQGYEFHSMNFYHHPMAKTERRRNIKNGGNDNVYLEHCRTCVNDKIKEWLKQSKQSDNSLSEYEKYELVIRNVTIMSNSMPTPEIVEYCLNKILEFGSMTTWGHIWALFIHLLAHPLLLLLPNTCNYLLQLYTSYYLYAFIIVYLIIFIPNIYRVYLMHCSRTLSQLQLVHIYTHLIACVLHTYVSLKYVLAFSVSADLTIARMFYSFHAFAFYLSLMKDGIIKAVFQFPDRRDSAEIIVFTTTFAFIVLVDYITVGLLLLTLIANDYKI
jgi:hypothetical protein